MRSLAIDVLHRLADTAAAAPALRLLSRVGPARIHLPHVETAAAILASQLDGDTSTFSRVVAFDSGGRARIGCDLHNDAYRCMFFSGHIPPDDRVAVDLIARRATAVDAVIDVGSNAGVFAYAAALAGARRVFAFEPVPRLAALLRRNTAANDWDSVIDVREELVGADEGTVQFFVTRHDSESTGAEERAAVLDVEAEISRPMVRLDSFCRREGIDPSRAIFKIDVEGCELAVLHGLGSALAGVDAPEMLVELLGESIQRGAIEDLCARGYQVFYLAADGPIHVRTRAEFEPRQDLLRWDFFLTKRGLQAGDR